MTIDWTSTTRALDELIEEIRGSLVGAGVTIIPGVLGARMKSLRESLAKAAAATGTQQPIRVQHARHWALRISAVLDAAGHDHPRDAARHQRARQLIEILLTQLERLGHTLH